MMETAQVTCGFLKGPCSQSYGNMVDIGSGMRKLLKQYGRGKEGKYGNWKKKNRQRHVRSTRIVDKMQR